MPDLTITPANVLPGATATLKSGIAGETLIAGQAVYRKTTDNKYYKAQCDSTAEEATVAGVAMHGATVNQPVTFQTDGDLQIGATTVKTTSYMLSATPGGIWVNQPVTFQTDGDLQIGATTVKTTSYMLSATPGGICPQADLVAGNRIVHVGYATDLTGAFTVRRVVTGVTV